MRATFTTLTVAACLALSACSGSSGTGSSTSRPSSSMPSASRTGPVAVLATDEPCTASVPLTATMSRLGVAPHELAAMVLEQSAFPVVATSGWQLAEDGATGYLGNQAYSGDYLSTEGCAALARTGRVTGYVRAWMNMENSKVVRSTAHLFSTPAGAAAFLDWLPSGYAKGQSFPAAYYTVTAGSSRRLEGVADGAVVIDASFGSTMNGSYVERIAAARVGDVVVTVDVQGILFDQLPMEPADVVAAATERARTAPRTGLPLDVVTVLSAPVPQKDLGPTYAALAPSSLGGGCMDAATAVARSSDPDLARTLADTGWLEAVRGFYSVPNETTPQLRVWTGISVHETPQGARAGQAHTVAALKAGDTQRDPATTFPVPGVPGAVGLLVARHSEGCLCSEAYVVLPARGVVVPVALVGDVPNADRRAEAVAAAVALDSRLDVLLGPAAD